MCDYKQHGAAYLEKNTCYSGTKVKFGRIYNNLLAR